MDIFGDRWSLLIIRDLLFTDSRRFSDFARADEAIATNVLTDRLELLECEGLILRRPDPADGRKFVYDLTRKGFDLAPVIVQMVIWAARHERTAAPPDLVRQMERDPEKFVKGLRARWERSLAPMSSSDIGASHRLSGASSVNSPLQQHNARAPGH